MAGGEPRRANIETHIKNAVRLMHGLKQPVALLFTGEFTI